MARIECIACGKIQGSMVCRSCRRKINELLKRGYSDEAIVKTMMPTRQTSLNEYVAS